MTRSRTNILALSALAVAIILALAHGWLLTRQSATLAAQTAAAERSRQDAVELLRIQSDLDQLGSAMSALAADEQRSITGAATQFDQIHHDLSDALTRHAALTQTADEQTFLSRPVEQFRKAAEIMFTLARGGHDAEARTQLRLTLQRQHAGLATTVAYLLLENAEEQRQLFAEMQTTTATLRQQSVWLPGAIVVVLLVAAVRLARSRPWSQSATSVS
jgi:hypothetical protein